jgi:hypothetical protein
MANAHDTATEPVDGNEDNAPDASGKANSRKDPLQSTDPIMLLLATTIFDMEKNPRCWQSQQDKSGT